MQRAHVLDDGALWIHPSLTIPANEIHSRLTTSGGPGGQHANRTLSKVVVSFDVAASRVLDEQERARLHSRAGVRISASSSQSRSQIHNRARALEALALRIAEALHEDAARRATRPTKSSVVRRLDAKKRRSTIKTWRRPSDDD